MKFYSQLLIVLVLDVVSALTARQSFETESTLYLILAMLSLAGAGYFFIQLLKERVTIIVNAIWIAFGSINVTVASYVAFGETITVMQGLGMMVIVIGLILIEAFSAEEEQVPSGKEILDSSENIL